MTNHQAQNPKGIIIGGGPAGSSAALALLRQNWAVAVHEQRKEWKGRVCGAFLSPEAVHHLEWLGLRDTMEKEGAIPVTTCHVTASNGAQSHVKISFKGRSGLALPRQQFEDRLLAAVREQGGRVHMGSRVRTLDFDADLVITADGRFSIGSDTLRQERSGWYGWNARFKLPHQYPGNLSIHFYPNGYVGLLTFADGTSNVSGLVYRKEKGPVSWDHTLENALRHQPFLRHHVRGGVRLGEWKGVGPLPYVKKMRWPATHLPVGDAAAVGDPFLGEGIGRALATGPMIAQSLHAMGSEFDRDSFLTRYHKLWDNSYRGRFLFGSLTRGAIKNSVLYKPVTRLLVGQQWLTQKVTHAFHRGYAAFFNNDQSSIIKHANPNSFSVHGARNRAPKSR